MPFKWLTEQMAGASFAPVTPDMYNRANDEYPGLRGAIEHLYQMDDASEYLSA